eukprot:TRINITY_DN7155_c0_g1_i1.p1 TRINITY_DN7155_c0_g1~~TRINITY_DN7155_c0_g1_i1.p1  ORF type:complete len:181 (-),score=35.37 TRINITY_DN7155_c0_g1_i1:107-619(-)
MEDPAASVVDLDERTQLMKIQILQEAEMDFASALQEAELKYYKELDPSVDATFSYAVALVRVKHEKMIEKGIKLLQNVLTKQLNKNKDIQRDCLYYIAYAYFRLEDYQEARKYITLAIRVEPNNHQALALESLIKDRITKEGLLGVAIVGGVVAAVGAVALLTVKGLSRN